MNSQWEREEEAIVEAFNRGEISRDEYNRQMREFQRAYSEEMRFRAEEAAQEAYENEMSRW